MTVSLNSNFFANARGFTFEDSATVTWAFNANTNQLTATGSGGGGGLTSVGLADTSTTPIFTVTDSPLIANGTLDMALLTQNANLAFMGPTSGGAAQPTFRALVPSDIPALTHSAISDFAAAVDALVSVGLADISTTPIYNVTNSPQTSGTLDIALKTQNANLVFAGPTTGGAAQPTFRALVAADIPSVTVTDSTLTWMAS